MTLERGRGPWTRTMFCIRLPCAVCGRRNRQVAGQTRRSATGDRSGVRRGARRSATRRYEPRRVGARAQHRSVTRAQMTTQRVADVRFAGCASSRNKECAVPARGWSGHWWRLLDYHAHACAAWQSARLSPPGPTGAAQRPRGCRHCVSLSSSLGLISLVSKNVPRWPGGLKIVIKSYIPAVWA